ncbi:MAG: response regulator [Desulfovibrio sp.]
MLNNISEPLRVLLVEDNEYNQILFKCYLQFEPDKEKPHHVDIAANGKEGVKMYQDNDYDIVFMDLEMPIMDGYDATRMIREHEMAKGMHPVPVVVVTAHATTAHESSSLEAGCSDFIVKPISKKDVLGAIEKHASPEAA